MWKALTLPVMEPLVRERLSNLVKVIMGCLLASVSVATSQSILGLNTNLNGVKEDENDLHAVEIIEKSLDLFNSTVALIRDSTRAGGHILQNFTTMGAWVLTTGILVQLTHTSQAAEKKQQDAGAPATASFKNKDTTKINLIKAQQGFGVLSVALGSQALTLVASMIDDLAAESVDEAKEAAAAKETPSKPPVEKIEPANFDLFHPFTATQRVALIFNSVPFIQLLFNVAVISYRKSCNLKCVLNKVRQKLRRLYYIRKDVLNFIVLTGEASIK